MNRAMLLKIARGTGAAVGYGFMAVFLWLVSVQIYRWIREGEWTHIGTSDGLRVGLSHCCVAADGTGRLAALVAWLDAPVDWLGLHKVLEVVPASLTLFVVSILGNFIFIYCSDRIAEENSSEPPAGRPTDGRPPDGRPPVPH